MAVPWQDVGQYLVTRPEPLWKRRPIKDSELYCTLLSHVGTWPIIVCYATNVCLIQFLVALFSLGQILPVVTSVTRTFASSLAGLGAIPWRIRVRFMKLCLWCLSGTVSRPAWLLTTTRSNPWGNSDANCVKMIAIWLTLSLIHPDSFLLRFVSRSSRNHPLVNLYLLDHPKLFGTTALS